MLSDQKIKAFIPTVDPDRAKNFYMNVLGLNLISEDYYGLDFEANGTLLRISTVQQFTPFPFTILGWEVDDLSSIIHSLNRRGVLFERYNIINQDKSGIWKAPGGVDVAWFKDPDGNLLSLTQYVNSSVTSYEDN
ncbi:MAG: VOC family protein [Paludibacter sp.]|nr:VOC family protein [Paludibacter sp.]